MKSTPCIHVAQNLIETVGETENPVNVLVCLASQLDWRRWFRHYEINVVFSTTCAATAWTSGSFENDVAEVAITALTQFFSILRKIESKMGVSKNAAPTNAGEKNSAIKSVSCEAQAFRRWSVESQCFRSAHLLKILQAQELKSAVQLDL